MHWPRSPLQQELSESLFLFRSPVAGCTTCLIAGHGLLPPRKPRFMLPEGVTMRYWVPHGEQNYGNPLTGLLGSAGATAMFLPGGLWYREGKTSETPVAPGLAITGPAPIEDYAVIKLIGREPRTGQVLIDYEQFGQAMEATAEQTLRQGMANCPHVVCVRWRSHMKRKMVALSEIIRAVGQQLPEVREFHFLGCRVEAKRHA